MNWDRLIRAKCTPVESADNPLTCPTTEPLPTIICSDLAECCADPAFRAKFPDLCDNLEILSLKLKPEFVIKGTLETVQYKTFLINENTGTEIELTNGLVYSVADTGIAIIGGASGNLTTLAEGITSVSVTWQNLSASAQLQVIGSGLEGCDETNVGMLLLLDNSRSMSSKFSDAYSTKLLYAKTLGKRFAEEVNVLKDKVGLATFNSSPLLVEALTDDNETVANSVMAVSSTTQQTDLGGALRAAVDHLNSQSGLTKKVIVLLSDGQHNLGDDPAPVANDFKAAGGLIIAVGIRSAGSAFQRLQEIASAGFFINATVKTEKESSDLLSGLKGYFCAGNCAPIRPTCGGRPQLNYTGFAHWDITAGWVDLIGEGVTGTSFDFLPGNGMYVDIAGSGPPWLGRMESKQAFTLINGVQYKLSYKLAGNQRQDTPGYRVRVQLGSLGSQEYQLDDWLQPFTEFSQTLAGDGGNHKIIIEQVSQGANPPFGNLLDNVKLERVDTGEVLLFDSFDDENEVCLPPPCGGFVAPSGATYYGYYCYGTGCLEEPVPEQKEDPNPPPETEGNQPPLGWTSYQCHTANCPAGSTGGSVTACEEATSTISQADADAKAKAAAKAKAESGLDCKHTFNVGDLCNIHINHANCALSDGQSPKKGFAAIGVTADDFWNAYGIFMGTAPFNHKKQKLDWERFWLTGGTFQGIDLLHPDQMFKCGLQGGLSAFDPVPATFPADTMVVDCIRPKQAGTYELYLYGHGKLNAATGKFNVRVGTITAGVLDGGYTDYGNKETINGAGFEDPGFLENKHFVKYTGIVVPSVNHFIIITRLKGADAVQSYAQGYQIKRTV